MTVVYLNGQMNFRDLVVFCTLITGHVTQHLHIDRIGIAIVVIVGYGHHNRRSNNHRLYNIGGGC